MSLKYIFSIVLQMYILLLYINCVYRRFFKSVKKSPPPRPPLRYPKADMSTVNHTKRISQGECHEIYLQCYVMTSAV